MSQVKERRFYRANLPKIVWDPEKKRAMARFDEGDFTTSDPRVIAKLVAIGYPEVSLDATTPPEIVTPLQVAGTPDISGNIYRS